jgi:hypothetical protein
MGIHPFFYKHFHRLLFGLPRMVDQNFGFLVTPKKTVFAGLATRGDRKKVLSLPPR